MAGPKTIEGGTLRIGSAFPSPPFEVERDGVDTGFDAELMRAVCGQVGLRWKLVKYEGPDLNGIFDGLRTGDYDVVASAMAITPDREKVAMFSDPYLEVDESLVVNAARSPHIGSVDDLVGEVVGIPTGHSSGILAQQLLDDGKLGEIRYYPYGAVVEMLDDLDAGRIGGLLNLAPVAASMVEDRGDLVVVQELATRERLGVACAPGSVGLRDAINRALAECRRTGLLERLARRWL